MAMTAYVIDAVRTPVGKRNGSLAGVHPIDLGVNVFARSLTGTTLTPPPSTTLSSAASTPSAVRPETSAGSPGWLRATPKRCRGYRRPPMRVQPAGDFVRAQAILSGTADLILAGGMQNMSQIPISSAMVVGKEFGFTTSHSGIQELAAALR